MAETPADPILQVENLSKHFDVSKPLINRLLERQGRRVLRAVDDVTFEIGRGETFALVGESGCGKSSLARCVAGLQRPSRGRVVFMDTPFSELRTRRNVLRLRRDMQMIFQDPYASLNPRWRVQDVIAEPMRTHGMYSERGALQKRVEELLSLVGLSPSDGRKFPHQFSGGQRQRISIARALSTNPKFIICDEPTSALDVSVQAQILNLMSDLQRELGLSYLLISHNLAVVGHMAERAAVMYLGRFVEWGEAATLFARPRHPYTQLLLETVPGLTRTERRRRPLLGEVPDPISPPAGCPFHPRCPIASDVCRREPPPVVRVDGIAVACHAAKGQHAAQASAPPAAKAV